MAKGKMSRGGSNSAPKPSGVVGAKPPKIKSPNGGTAGGPVKGQEPSVSAGQMKLAMPRWGKDSPVKGK